MRSAGLRSRGTPAPRAVPCPRTFAVEVNLIAAEQILDARVERDGDLVKARNRRARFGAFDLREERDTEPGSPAHLLQRQLFFFSQSPDGVADDPMELLFGSTREPLLPHHAGQHFAEFVDVERLL